MGEENASITRTTESGAFIRVTLRTGSKRKQKTERITKSQKKVVLGHLGDFEVYVYPWDYPDTVFIGKFPISTKIDKEQEGAVLAIAQKIRHYLEGHYFNRPNWRKGANSRKRDISRAYNLGLDERKKRKTNSVHV